MNKLFNIYVLLPCLLALSCRGAFAAGLQPTAPTVEQRLVCQTETFAQKTAGSHQNRIMNLQYKRYGRQALISFDLTGPGEVILVLYLLEFTGSNWRVCKEYRYVKSTSTLPAPAC